MMPLCVCLLIGQTSVLFLPENIFILILCAAVFVLLAFSRRMDRKLFFFGFILAAFLIAGRLLGSSALKPQPAIPEGSPQLCEGTVKDSPVFTGKGWQFDAALEKCGRGNARLFTPELFESLEKGDRIRFLAKFKEPRVFKNPGSFNYPLYLLTQGIDYTGSLVGPKWMIKIGEESQNFLVRAILKTRNSIDRAISSACEGDTAGILRAITIGKRDKISQGTRDAFAHTGVAHLLAISGLHVGYAALIIFFVIRLLCGLVPRLSLIWPVQRIAAVASLPFVWLYVAVAGFPISAVRAGVMLTVFLVSLFFLWRRDLLSALATAVFAILIVSPASLFSTSFQLSAVSVFAIISLTPVIIDKFKGKAHRLLSVVAVTIAATLGSAPLVAYYFHFISAVGFFANIIAVPFAGVILMPLAIAASVLTVIYAPAGIYLWKPAAVAASLLVRFVSFLDQHTSAIVFSWAPSITEVLFAYAGIAAVVFWNRLPYKRLVAGTLAAFLVLDVGYWHMGPVMRGSLEVTFFDVGHGDSILVRFPNNHVTLIDGGGIKGSDFDVGRNILSPALLRMGIRRVDDLILTHPHHDHYKGLAAIAENFKPRILYTNGGDAPQEEAEDWEEFLSRIKAARVRIETVSNLTLEEGGASLTVFAPEVRDISILDPNDASLVIRLTYKNRSILLTGDLMDIGERTLIENRTDLASDVLKVAHHGSETSTSIKFLETIKPQIAVISVGLHNQYGLPDQIVMGRLQQIGARVYRTDLDGAITVRIGSKSFDVETFVKN